MDHERALTNHGLACGTDHFKVLKHLNSHDRGEMKNITGSLILPHAPKHLFSIIKVSSVCCVTDERPRDDPEETF
ncbi:hypothetical protein [Roseovarius sp.]|uniref:hypothetical protein n=1 Tax=Roseovarius sp. TaxID=1486281 RepID=UPI00257D722B|nr:hypothetical protein [Roseovarius sp.]